MQTYIRSFLHDWSSRLAKCRAMSLSGLRVEEERIKEEERGRGREPYHHQPHSNRINSQPYHDLGHVIVEEVVFQCRPSYHVWGYLTVTVHGSARPPVWHCCRCRTDPCRHVFQWPDSRQPVDMSCPWPDGQDPCCLVIQLTLHLWSETLSERHLHKLLLKPTLQCCLCRLGFEKRHVATAGGRKSCWQKTKGKRMLV